MAEQMEIYCQHVFHTHVYFIVNYLLRVER